MDSSYREHKRDVAELKKTERKDLREMSEENRQADKTAERENKIERKVIRKEEKEYERSEREQYKIRAQEEAEELREHKHEKKESLKISGKEAHAQDELTMVRHGMDDALKKRELHISQIHHWVRRINKAVQELMKAHEESVEKERDDPILESEVEPLLFEICTDLSKLETAIHKISHSHHIKGNEFEAINAHDHLLAINVKIDQAIFDIPAGI